jgi:hypothetical protein
VTPTSTGSEPRPQSVGFVTSWQYKKVTKASERRDVGH